VTAAETKRLKNARRWPNQLYGQVLEADLCRTNSHKREATFEKTDRLAFGVSRPWVREALRKLQEDGWSRHGAAWGSFVRRAAFGKAD